MLSQVKINDRVAIRTKAGGDFASIKDDAGNLHTAVINELRNDKVVLMITDSTGSFLSSCKVGTKALLQKPGSSGVTICRAVITAILSHAPQESCSDLLPQVKRFSAALPFAYSWVMWKYDTPNWIVSFGERPFCEIYPNRVLV